MHPLIRKSWLNGWRCALQAGFAGGLLWIGLLTSGCALTSPAAQPAAPEPIRASTQAQSKPAKPAAPAPRSSNAGTDRPAGGVDAAYYDENLDFLEEEEPAITIADPLEPWNRAMFTFNDRLYFWVLKPVAQGYIRVTPSFFRVGARNFFNHLETPIRFAGCLLQGKFKGAGTELARFILNTVWGGLGTWDAAAHFSDLAMAKEDVGQALGRYGIGNGLYLVWPVFGPSTLRDTVGRIGERYLDPVGYLEPLAASAAATGFKTVNSTSFRIGDYETVIKAAMDPYDAVRDGYLQFRRKQINE